MEPIMEATVERCAGLDIHQASVVACVLVGPPECKPRKETRSFGTSTRELEGLRAWLEGLGVNARRHGEHRGLLEAGPRRPRGPLRADRRQRAPHQGGAGAQD